MGLNLCTVLKEPEALDWAEELWGEAMNGRFQLHDKAYSDYLTVLESFRLHDRFDEMLSEFRNNSSIDRVFLSGVVNIATNHRDWQRSDELWDIIVNQLGVKPG